MQLGTFRDFNGTYSRTKIALCVTPRKQNHLLTMRGFSISFFNCARVNKVHKKGLATKSYWIAVMQFIYQLLGLACALKRLHFYSYLSKHIASDSDDLKCITIKCMFFQVLKNCMYTARYSIIFT